MHWCEAAQAEHLDCGALAAIAGHLMGLRGAHVVRVQLIEKFNAQNVRCWTALWEDAGVHCRWAFGSLVYHEAVGVVQEGLLRVWDPTDGLWLEPDDPQAYGATLAIRVTTPSGLRSCVQWGGRRVTTDRWEELWTEEPPVQVG
jgi:hypothetical protein